MKLNQMVLALGLALAATGAFAAPTAVVEGVQMPAWVERGGVKQPLAAGMELKESDKLSTGQNSRVLLRLAEGSLVKLGENAQLDLDKLSQKQENKQTFLQAAMDVARGAVPLYRPPPNSSSIRGARSIFASPPSPPGCAVPISGASRAATATLSA